MTRINLFHTSAICRSTPKLSSIAWGKPEFKNDASILAFAGLLMICSLAVGCSSEKPKPETSTPQAAISQTMPPASTNAPSASAVQAAAKPVHKRVVHRAPATVAYSDKESGVSFEYPRKYALKTGDAADELVSSSLVPMNFAQPGGTAMAAVSVPEGAYPKSDLLSASFDVSVNKSLIAEQCGEFATAQSNPPAQPDTVALPAATPTKLIIGNMELQSAETLGSVESRKEESKYYHVFENGACYEFALRVATTGVDPDEGGKAVDRDEVFKRLEKILATVKINPLKVEKEVATTPIAPASPAQ